MAHCPWAGQNTCGKAGLAAAEEGKCFQAADKSSSRRWTTSHPRRLLCPHTKCPALGKLSFQAGELALVRRLVPKII